MIIQTGQDNYDEGKLTAIRNPDGIFINTQCFKEEAQHFTKHGYYCPDPWGSPAWTEYWIEQLKRCKYGYASGGVHITGDHYKYLNFAPIMKLDFHALMKGETEDDEVAKIEGFPDFWDGDYNYNWAVEIARKGVLRCPLFKSKSEAEQERIKQVIKVDSKEKAMELKKLFEEYGLEVQCNPDYLEGGWHVIVGKARRKGYSYKNGSKAVNIYNHTVKGNTVIGAFEKKYLYPEGTMMMATAYMNFINEHTGWAKAREYVDKQDHKRASYKEIIKGIPVEKGYRSQVFAVTFKDNPSAARGKDAKLILFEEAGKFPNMRASFKATEPSLRAGSYTTGQIIIFGTGGDMESGTVDFANMFYNPTAYNLMPFENIWDDNAEGSFVGFFHPVYWNMEGYYDEDGNSDREGAMTDENARRKKMLEESSDGSLLLQEHVQEWCQNPSEAFLMVGTNDFPIAEIRNQLNLVERMKLHTKYGQAVHLMYDQGKVVAKPDLKNELQPIWHYKPKVANLAGAPVIFEYPVDKPPRGLYKISYDPYRQEQSTGLSLAAVHVYKGTSEYTATHSRIVAQYIGRPSTTDDCNRIVMMLAELYNAEVMFENEVTSVRAYFLRKKRLNYLASQPNSVISANIQNSKVDRTFGCHMVDKLKDAGEKYIKRMLLEVIGANGAGDPVTFLDTIWDPGLLEELIQYNRKGNFDRVMSLMMLTFAIEEDGDNKTYSRNPSDVATQLIEMMPNLYKKRA